MALAVAGSPERPVRRGCPFVHDGQCGGHWLSGWTVQQGGKGSLHPG